MQYSPFDKDSLQTPTNDVVTSDESTGIDLLTDPIVSEYYQFKPGYLRNFTTPKDSIVYPQDTDYQAGYFQRYFIKKRNDPTSKIIEVDVNQYNGMTLSENGIDENLYFGIEVDWKIAGFQNDVISNGIVISYGVADTNARTLILKEQVMPGISVKLTNLIQFAKFKMTPVTQSSIQNSGISIS